MIPFTDQGEAAVCARVFYQWVKLCHRRREEKYSSPVFIIDDARLAWPGQMNLVMGLVASSMRACCGSSAQSSSGWLNGILDRDKMGVDFRRAIVVEYKANRRGNPRVTNRGVTFSQGRTLAALDKAFTAASSEDTDD